DVSKAEHAGCAAKLALADGRQGRRAGMLGVSWRMAAVTATLTARCRHQGNVHAFRRILRQRAAETQRFIVRVREHGHQPTVPHEVVILADPSVNHAVSGSSLFSSRLS